MSEKKSITYKDAGVDVEAGYKAVELMKKHVKTTFDKNVLSDIGSFGGFYDIAGIPETADSPVLVAGTDGVGTKLKYAFVLDKHDTIGIDCVAMCVNDVVCQGARPLFFLDYFATGKLKPEVTATVVSGIADGCRQAGCALIGGETAEMPGFYSKDEYDMAGFSVGIVSRSKIINGRDIKAGDALIGIASSGLHSNGYSLVRKVFGEDKAELLKINKELGKPLAEVLLTPTKIYVKTILDLISKFNIKGLAHITGGGFIENIPRIIPEGLGISIDRSSYEVPRVFTLLQEMANIQDRQIYNTLNMGIGMVVCVDKNIAGSVAEYINSLGEKAYIIGEVTGAGGVSL